MQAGNFSDLMQILQAQQQQYQLQQFGTRFTPQYPPPLPSNLPFFSLQLCAPPLNPDSTTGSTPSAAQYLFSRADDETLARAMRDGRGTRNWGETLRLLNGVNNHTTEYWNAYYNENSLRIDALELDIFTPTTFVETLAPSDAPHKQTLKHTQPNTDKRTDHKPSSPSKGRDTSKGSVRRQKNTNGRPSKRSGKVPQVVTSKKRGNKFTDKDLVLFRTYFSRVLERKDKVRGPGRLSMAAIARALASRSPRHSASSWRSWMRDNSSAVENVRRLIRAEEQSALNPPDDDGDRSSEVVEQDGDDDDADVSDTRHALEEADASLSLSSSESEGGLRARDAATLANSVPNSYLPSEVRALAKYIAKITLARWDNISRAPAWRDFQTKNKTHTAAAWRQWYRLNEKKVRCMARRIEIRQEKRVAQAGTFVLVTKRSSQPLAKIPPRLLSCKAASESGHKHGHKGACDDDDADADSKKLTRRSKSSCLP